MAEPKQKAATGVNLDCFSDLPNEVLCHIISFLPTKDAIRTSILSPRWKDLFLSSSKLDLNDYYVDDQHVQSFINIVERILMSGKPLDSFKLHFNRQRIGVSRVLDWISVVLRSGVKKLTLRLTYPDDKHTPLLLPDDLYTSKSLVALTLSMSDFQLNIPAVIRLPNLKTLHLAGIEFLGNDSVKRLLSNCSALEDLTIDDCSMYEGKVHISNSTLKRLEYNETNGRWDKDLVVIETPGLVKLDLFLHENATGVMWLKELLKCSPNLSTLYISEIFEPDEVWFPPQHDHEVPYCLANQLKEVKFHIFNEEDSRLCDMITYFLMCSRVLEKLSICVDCMVEEKKSKIVRKLLEIFQGVEANVKSWSYDKDIDLVFEIEKLG